MAAVQVQLAHALLSKHVLDQSSGKATTVQTRQGWSVGHRVEVEQRARVDASV